MAGSQSPTFHNLSVMLNSLPAEVTPDLLSISLNQHPLGAIVAQLLKTVREQANVMANIQQDLQGSLLNGDSALNDTLRTLQRELRDVKQSVANNEAKTKDAADSATLLFQLLGTSPDMVRQARERGQLTDLAATTIVARAANSTISKETDGLGQSMAQIGLSSDRNRKQLEDLSRDLASLKDELKGVTAGVSARVGDVKTEFSQFRNELVSPLEARLRDAAESTAATLVAIGNTSKELQSLYSLLGLDPAVAHNSAQGAGEASNAVAVLGNSRVIKAVVRKHILEEMVSVDERIDAGRRSAENATRAALDQLQATTAHQMEQAAQKATSSLADRQSKTLETTRQDILKVVADDTKAWNQAKMAIFQELARKADKQEFLDSMLLINRVDDLPEMRLKLDRVELLAGPTPELQTRVEMLSHAVSCMDGTIRLLARDKAEREELYDAIHNVNVNVHVPEPGDINAAARFKCLTCHKGGNGPMVERKPTLWEAFPPAPPASVLSSKGHPVRPASAAAASGVRPIPVRSGPPGPTRRNNSGVRSASPGHIQARMNEYFSVLDAGLPQDTVALNERPGSVIKITGRPPSAPLQPLISDGSTDGPLELGPSRQNTPTPLSLYRQPKPPSSAPPTSLPPNNALPSIQ